MRPLLKKSIFFILLAVVFCIGVFVVMAVNNRGNAPVAYLKFDEGTGSTAYDSSGSNDGTISGAVWKNENECKSGKCLYFDGTGDTVTLNDSASLDLSSGATISAWVKSNSIETNDSIASKDNAYSLDFINDAADYARFRIEDDSSVWHTLAGSSGDYLFREPFDNTLMSGSTFTPNFGYRTLTGGSSPPTNLASNQGITITQSDNLQYTRGSLQGGDGSGVVYENFDPNQGSLEFWVRPNWDGDDGIQHDIFNDYPDSTNWLILRKSSSNFWVLNYRASSTSYQATVDASSAVAGRWYHIVGVWSTNENVSDSNKVAIYVNAGTVGTNAGTTNKFTTSASVFFIGQDTSSTNQFNGVIAGRILNRPLTSTEVTALYNSGAGSTESFAVTPGTVWMGIYSDDDDDAVFQHQGQQVSAIADGATESTITLGEAVGGRSWTDNDRVVVWDGTGYKKEGRIDEGGGILTTDTTLDVDDGAGALVSGLSNVGKSLDFDATYYAQAANNTIHDITTQDIGISAWVRLDTGSSSGDIICKSTAPTGPNPGFEVRNGTSGNIIFTMKDSDNDEYNINGTTDLRDNKWHNIAIIVDRSNNANCKIYLDGYDDTDSEDGAVALAAVDSLTNSQIFTIGARSSGNLFFDGQIRDVFLAYDADITGAGEMGASGKVLALATNPRDTSQVNYEDYWALTDNAASTTVTGAVNNLTASANTDTFSSQEAFISKNLAADSGMENGGIGVLSFHNSPTTVQKTSGNIYDAQALHVVTGTSASSYNGVRWNLSSYDGEDFLFSFKHKLNSGDMPVYLYTITGGYITINTNFGSDSTVQEFETVVKVMPNTSNELISLSKPYNSTNGSDFYIDEVKLLSNLVDSGGFNTQYDYKSNSDIFSASTIGKTGSGWTVDAYQNETVKIVSGTGSGQIRSISSNTADTLTITPDWDTTPDATSDFFLLGWVSDVSDGWTNQGAATVGRDTNRIKSSSADYSQQVTGGSSTENVKQDVSVVSGKYYTVSGWLNRSSGTGNTVMELSGAGTATLTHNTSTWTKKSFTFKAASSTLTIELYNDEGSTVGMFDDVSLIQLDQIEPSTSTPSTSANSFNTGKWSDASGAILVDGADTLTYPQSGNIDNETGSISFWVKPNGFDESTPDDKFWLDTRDSTPDQGFYIKMDQSADDVAFAGDDSAGGTWSISSSGIDWTANEWHYIAVTYDCSQSAGSDAVNLYIDGSSAASDASETCAAWTLPANFYLNADYTGANQGDSYVDELRTFDHVLTSTEVSNLYSASAGSYDAGTSRVVQTNQWQLITGVFDGSNLYLYQNGVLQRSYAIGSSKTIANSASDLILGDSFTGYLDDFKVYNYARSAEQVKADYVAGSVNQGSSIRLASKEQQQDAGEGLVGYWKMDEASWDGTADEVIDSSGNSNHLVRQGDATTAAGKYGNAGTFDGTGDYACTSDASGDCEDDDDLDMGTSDFTLETWVKRDTSAISEVLIDKRSNYPASGGTGYILSFQADDTVKLVLSDGINYPGVSSSSGISDTSWHHIAVVADRDSNAQIYLDGVADGSAVDISSVGSIDSTQNFITGIRFTLTDDAFDGKLDDIKIYKTVRSAEQIMMDYETGPPPADYWKMDEKVSGDGQTIYDSSGSNNGTTDDGANNTGMDCTKSGKYGSACEFDNVDDYVDLGTGITSLRYDRDFTFTAWIKPYTWPASDTDIIFAQAGGGHSIIIQRHWNGTTIEFYHSDDTGSQQFSGATSLEANTWYHIAFVNKDSAVEIFLDGKSDRAPTALTKDSDPSGQSARLGKNAVGNYPFDGLIDDVRIYNYALTQKQVVSVMNADHPAVGSPVGSYVGYWNFDEGQGTVAHDKSNNNNDGTITGADWTLNGKMGGALDFVSGNSDYVDISGIESDISVSEGTISAWIQMQDNIESDSSTYGILELGDASSTDDFIGFRKASDNTLVMRYRISGTNYDAVVSDISGYGNTWKHIVGVWDSNNIYIYENGIQKDSAARGSDITQSNLDQSFIGVDAQSIKDYYFSGLIDEVKVYPFALSPAEIKQEYNQGKVMVLGSTRNSSSTWDDGGFGGDAPVGWWKMDEKADNTCSGGVNDVCDVSGNGNDGASSGGPTWKSAGQCHQGACLSFNGSSDYIDVGAGPSTVKTVSFWAYPATTTEYPLDLNGTAYVWFNAGTVTAQGFTDPTIYVNGIQATTVAANQWQHIAVTTGTGLDASDLDIGAYDIGGSPSYFNGKIDDVRIYDYARTPAQIAWEYNRGNPTAEWKMDSVAVSASPGAALKVYDESNNSNDGTTSGETMNNGTITAATWKHGSDCKYGSCLEFDGSSAYVNMGNVLNMGTDDFSVSAWIKFSDKSSYHVLVSKRNGWTGSTGFHTGTLLTGGFWVEIEDVDGDEYQIMGSADLSDNEWHHVVATIDRDDNTNCKLYVDGTVDATGSATGLADADESLDNALDFSIGSLSGGGSKFNGLIDDVRIYNTALSAAEITALYQNDDRTGGGTISEDNLVGEWPMNENNGSYVADSHYLRYGKRSYAMNFDGTDDYIGIGSFALPSTTVDATWEGWFNAAAGETVGLIFDNRQFYISWSASMRLDIYTTGGWAQGTGGFYLDLGLSQQNWYHFTVVVHTAETRADVYVNGVYRTNITTQAGNLSNGGACNGYKIGKHCSDSSTSYFNGSIDDIRVYNYARTDDQILQDYNEGAAVRFGPEEGLP